MNSKLRKSYNKFLKTCDIENYESMSNFYTKNEYQKLSYFDFLKSISTNEDFRNKWLIDPPSLDNLKDNSRIQQETLLNIILNILNDQNLDKINQHGNKGQVWYLFANAVASYSNYNNYYFVSESALKVIKEQKINTNIPISRSKLFQIRENKKKLLTFEHMCPATQLIEYMIKLKNSRTKWSYKSLEIEIKDLLMEYGIVAILTKIEDKNIPSNLTKKLNNIKMKSSEKMLDRYNQADIVLEKTLITVYGKMYR